MKAKGIGKLHTSAEALVYTVLKKRFGKSSAAVESLPVTGDSLGSINKYLLDAADVGTCARKTSNAHGTFSQNGQAPRGCFLVEGKLKCQGCGKEVKDPTAHNYKNCKARLTYEEIQKATTGASGGSMEARHGDRRNGSASPANGKGPKKTGNHQRQGQAPGTHRAHLTEIEEEEDGDEAGAQGRSYVPEGQKTLSFACSALPPTGPVTSTKPILRALGPNILDSGASITTVGHNTPLKHIKPSCLTLKMTGSVSHRVSQGLAAFRFLDINKKPVVLLLPAITSPDVDPDIVLISLSQLLKKRFDVRLSHTSGRIITPCGSIILLSVGNGTWHFPSVSSQKECVLDVKDATADMVLGRATKVAYIRKLPPCTSYNNSEEAPDSCIDQEPSLLSAEDEDHDTELEINPSKQQSPNDSCDEQATSQREQATSPESRLLDPLHQRIRVLAPATNRPCSSRLRQASTTTAKMYHLLKKMKISMSLWFLIRLPRRLRRLQTCSPPLCSPSSPLVAPILLSIHRHHQFQRANAVQESPKDPTSLRKKLLPCAAKLTLPWVTATRNFFRPFFA
jgi:hypothetical protein